MANGYSVDFRTEDQRADYETVRKYFREVEDISFKEGIRRILAKKAAQIRKAAK